MDVAQQERNFAHLFRLFDANGNGSVGFDDYQRIVAGVAGVHGVSPGNPTYDALEAAFHEDWVQMAAHADKDADNRVSLAEWTAYQKAAVATDAGFEIAVASLTAVVLTVVDADGDGRISAADYAKMARAFNLGADDAAASFARLDTDDDGVVSTDEITRAAAGFHRPSSAEDPGNWLFGPVS